MKRERFPLCPACGKILFPTKAHAETRLFYLRSIHSVLHADLQRVYECKKGGGWHLTSRP